MYKKLFSLLLSVVFIFSLITVVPSTVTAFTEKIFYEDFESYDENSYPTSITLKYNGTGTSNQKVITTTQYNDTTGKVFRLQGASGWASEQYVNLPNPLPEVLTVEAYIKPISGIWPGEIGLRNYSVGTWGTRVSSVWFDDNGKITAVQSGNNSSRVEIGTYTMNTWYHVVLENNMSTRKYNVSINGVTAATDIPMNPTVDPKQLTLISGNYGTNEIYFDNVAMYSYTPQFYTVTFDKNGGETEANPKTITILDVEEKLSSLPTEPTRTDYTFDGWWTGNGDPDDGIGIDGGDGYGTKFTLDTKVSSNISVYAKWNLIDNTPPIVSAGEVIRISNSEATVKFTSDEEGYYYYKVVDSGTSEPTIDTSTSGVSCNTSEQTISLNSLTEGAKDIYIVVKDASSNVSTPVKIEIPEYVPPKAETPVITKEPTEVTAIYGNINAALTVTASVSDGGTLSYKWYKSTVNSNENGEVILGEANSSYTLPQNLDAGTYYYYCEVTNTTNEGNFSIAVTSPAAVTINKAEPTFTVPAELSATYGDTLADVVLPEGFQWEDDLTTLVGNPGDNAFNLKYVPQDTDNYLIVPNISVTVQVKKGETILNYDNEDDESGITLAGLENKVNLPEKNQENTKEVTISIKVDNTKDNSEIIPILDSAKESLKEKDYSLLYCFDISIIKTVVDFDGSVIETKLPNSDITAPLTIRMPIPEELLEKSKLAVVYISDEGSFEILEGKRVTIEGKEYLEFETDHFSLYSIVEPIEIIKAEELPDTGGFGANIYYFMGLMLIGAGLLILKKRNNIKA